MMGRLVFLGDFDKLAGGLLIDHVYKLRETKTSLTVDKRRPGGRRRLAGDMCVNHFGAMPSW